jgi:hypothetical protein
MRSHEGVETRSLRIICPKSGRVATCTLVAVDGTYAEVLACSEHDEGTPIDCDQCCARMLNHDVDLEATDE